MVGNVRNTQEAMARVQSYGGGREKMKYIANYISPMERVVFHCTVNPMVLLLESLWVVSGRPVREGFADYGQMLYPSMVGGTQKYGHRITRFSTTVCDGRLDAEVVTKSAVDLYRLVSDAVCISTIQEKMASQHGLRIGTFSHICEDVSKVDFTGFGANPYGDVRVTPHSVWSQSLASHLSMFLDEGMALGVRDPFLGNVANPVAEALRAYLSKSDERFDEALACLNLSCHYGNDWISASASFLEYQKRSS